MAIMKSYMANRSFSRGIEQLPADASIAIVGNTSNDVSCMIGQTDLFEDLPAMCQGSAVIDRPHTYVQGWEMSVIRDGMFSKDFGLTVDYLAEAFRNLHTLDHSGGYGKWFELSKTPSSRNRGCVDKTFSGLLTIAFPGRNQTKDETRELLEFAMELRKRVKDQIYQIGEN